MSTIARAWPAAVGELLAGHSRPVSFKAGVLRIECGSSVYAQELELMSRKVLEALSRELGEGIVKELRFSVGGHRTDG